MNNAPNFIIIGGGIVGLATALKLSETYPDASIRILEKEPALARHQTGNNSGVVHAGVYYQPGSLKAEFCRTGGAMVEQFCAEHGIAFNRCGKLIVATNDIEVERMKTLQERCIANGLSPTWLNREALEALEPNITGVAALHVTESAITDYTAITLKMADLLRARGHEIHLDTHVTAIEETDAEVTVTTSAGRFSGSHLIVCGGLIADRLAKMCGVDLDFRIVPFRGEYYELDASKATVCQNMIYPVPDPEMPFLGIHLTPTTDGRMTVGPNAVLSLAREGYSWADINLRDLLEMVRFSGFRQVIKAHWKSGLTEFRNSLSRKRYLEQCRKYCPSLTLNDLKTRSAGVRAQAVLADGTLVHDFLLKNTTRTLHVCNAPSPAATSSFAIGEYLVERATTEFSLK
ncbi:L-2-hydroxyglutarate oxidase [Leucothrix sargassi]|nr:L-2-hydroxyglutarate oxidase [Leucothrix sargassi]